MITIEMIYERGDATADDLAAAVAEILANSHLATGELAERAAQAGIDPAVLPTVSISVTEDSQGLEPILTSIVIGLTVRAGETIAETLWRKVVWPLARRKLGARALSGPGEIRNTGADSEKLSGEV
jgi:hypothetical protein